MVQERPLRKAELCHELGARLLINDQLVHALECSQRGIEVFLFGDTAYNQAAELPQGVTRVSGWHEIGQLLKH